MAIITKYLTTRPLDRDNTLMVNSLTGAVDIIGNKDKAAIESLMNGSRPEDIRDQHLVSTLRKRGYLFDSEQDELRDLQKINSLYEKFLLY